jgi:aminopeptidase YwaD
MLITLLMLITHINYGGDSMRFKKVFSVVLSLFISFGSLVYAAPTFNYSNVYKIAEELSSDKYTGRLAGDKGNKLAEQYIASYFNSLNLKPGGDNNSFFQKFEVYVPMIKGSCYFKIYDENKNVVKEYKYGIHFKEVPYGASIGGTVKGKLKLDGESEGNILLAQSLSIGESPSYYKADLTLKQSGVEGIVYPTNRNFRFRSPYKLQKGYSDGLIKIMVTKDIVPELIEFSKKNYAFEIKSPVQTKKVAVNNVIGILEGKDKSLPPIILSAHFDHVGYDADGVIYPGAFDNASGTAFLLECARVLKATPNLERTIIFAAFNAEEEGLLGSQYFVEHSPVPLKDAECINFDMVGSVENIPLAILSLPTRSNFSNTIAQIAKQCSVETKILYEDNSDHAPFCNKGINSVTLIHDDVTKIHTPDDTIKNMDKDKLEEVFITLNTYLKSKDIAMASAKINDLNYKTILFITVVGSALIIAIVGIYIYRKEIKLVR